MNTFKIFLKQSAKFLLRKNNSRRYTVPLIGPVQTMSQLEAENARLKLTVQETREALDQSKTVEVRTPYHLANLEDQSHDLFSFVFQVLEGKVAVKCALFFC
jgi:hypothetical protein